VKDNKLFLRRNKDRKTDKHPEFKGSGVVFGKEVWLSAWVNEGDDGSKYFAINVTEKNENNTRTPPPKEAPKSVDFNDELGW